MSLVTTFEDPADVELGERFLEQGYLVLPAENMDGLVAMRH